MKTLAELVNTAEPGWPIVAEMFATARRRVEVLPVEPAAGERALLAIQVTTRSPMGAIAHSSGGLLVDSGWVRVLGGGNARLPRDIGSWNFPGGAQRLANALLVADDVLGGFFALNGGAFDGPLGNVFYLAPDTLRWEDLGGGYTRFLEFLCVGDFDKYYGDQRWPGWVDETRSLAGDRAFSIYPFLFTKGGPVASRSRREVLVEELWGLYAEHLPAQLDR